MFMTNDLSSCGCCLFFLILLIAILVMIVVIFPKLALVGLILALFAVIFLIGWSILTQAKDLNSGELGEE